MIISIESIDKVLPQTQCTKCGYDDCYSYAKAITNGENYNKCITGGKKTIQDLSHLLKKPIIKLDKTLGVEKPIAKAVIDESMCIGCTKCILACPVDAIIGAKNFMHTIIESECTGCELCIEPCPMDCISMVDLAEENQSSGLSVDNYEKQKNHFRDRYHSHKQREEEKKTQKRNVYKNIATAEDIDKKAYIAASLAKFRNKKKLTTDNE